jgi:hypothetical protein
MSHELKYVKETSQWIPADQWYNSNATSLGTYINKTDQGRVRLGPFEHWNAGFNSTRWMDVTFATLLYYVVLCT